MWIWILFFCANFLNHGLGNWIFFLLLGYDHADLQSFKDSWCLPCCARAFHPLRNKGYSFLKIAVSYLTNLQPQIHERAETGESQTQSDVFFLFGSDNGLNMGAFFLSIKVLSMVFNYEALVCCI